MKPVKKEKAVSKTDTKSKKAPMGFTLTFDNLLSIGLLVLVGVLIYSTVTKNPTMQDRINYYITNQKKSQTDESVTSSDSEENTARVDANNKVMRKYINIFGIFVVCIIVLASLLYVLYYRVKEKNQGSFPENLYAYATQGSIDQPGWARDRKNIGDTYTEYTNDASRLGKIRKGISKRYIEATAENSTYDTIKKGVSTRAGAAVDKIKKTVKNIRQSRAKTSKQTKQTLINAIEQFLEDTHEDGLTMGQLESQLKTKTYGTLIPGMIFVKNGGGGRSYYVKFKENLEGELYFKVKPLRRIEFSTLKLYLTRIGDIPNARKKIDQYQRQQKKKNRQAGKASGINWSNNMVTSNHQPRINEMSSSMPLDVVGLESKSDGNLTSMSKMYKRANDPSKMMVSSSSMSSYVGDQDDVQLGTDISSYQTQIGDGQEGDQKSDQDQQGVVGQDGVQDVVQTPIRNGQDRNKNPGQQGVVGQG